MYEFIQGRLVSKQADHVVIETAGVGYRLKISYTTYEHLPLPGEGILLYTYLHVREDIFELYGFKTTLEREFFFKLIGISKVGPKAALSILSGGSPEDISNWIYAEDSKTLAKTPGIGPTTAKRIILELKPKLEKGLGSQAGSGSQDMTGVPAVENEAILALEALGYSRSDVYAKIKKIVKEDGDNLTTESLIKKVLQKK